MCKNKRAFTLIELLVVVLIIGILSAVALPQYTKTVERVRLSEAVQNVSHLQKAIDIYLLENGFPTTNVVFLGNGASGKDLLNVDITKSMNCVGGTYCESKYFVYAATCSTSKCSIRATYQKSYSELLVEKYPDRKEWEKNCEYDEDEYLCKSLEPLGFTRSSCC